MAFGKTILIIGHKARHDEVYCQALPQSKLVYAENGSEGLNFIGHDEFDLIVIHYKLPDQNGLNLLRNINFKTGGNVPTILLIPNDDKNIIRDAIKEGISDYIQISDLVPSVLAMIVTRAIENKKWEELSRKVSEKKELSPLKDPVTQVFNRVYFETRLKEEIIRSRRFKFPLTLILLKVNHFKKIRNQYGNDFSDTIIKETSELLIDDLRSSDLLARIHDDEFALLLPHTNTDQAKMAWERISKKMKNHSFSTDKKNVVAGLDGTIIEVNKDIEAIDIFLNEIKNQREKTEIQGLFFADMETAF